MAHDPNANSFRMPEGPAEPAPESAGDETGGRKADKGKIVILIVLLLAGTGVVAWQFLRTKGPQEASAKPLAAGARAAAPGAPAEVDTVLQKMTGAASEEKDGLTVKRVEQLVKEFDTYVHRRQIPLKDLRINPFEVVLDAPAPAETPAAKEEDAKAAEEQARKEKVREAASRLALSSILVSDRNRLAVINGNVYGVGEAVEGLKIESIDTNRVVVSGEKVTVELKLFEPGATPGRAKGRG